VKQTWKNWQLAIKKKEMAKQGKGLSLFQIWKLKKKDLNKEILRCVKILRDRKNLQ